MVSDWLPDDIARCSGDFPDVSPYLWDCCKDCLRRTSRRTAPYGSWMAPQVVEGECEYRIEP